MASVNMTAMLADAVKASDETDTTKSRSTPSDTASSTSTLIEEPESHHYDDATLAQLARQLEYYFSQANLDKDTYVETLRQLNDGYVPVSILQRFSKVQAFTPIETVDAVVKAATDFSSLLEVASIDTKTGKRVIEGVPGAITILAVGSTSGKPLDLTGLPGVVPTTPKSPVQNTIIIREVETTVTEEVVRALFDDEHCPPIQSLYLDVFNCWFVTLDTISRDDMLYVMMRLRCQYLGDEPVKARLKSLVRQVDPTHAPGLPILTPVSSYTQLSNLSYDSGHTKTSKRKQKKRNNKNSGNNNNNRENGNNQGGKKTNSNQNNKGNREGNNNKVSEVQQQPKPDLSAASFPALTPESAAVRKMVEVCVDGGMDSAAPSATNSDSSSTTTTLSSSSSAGKQLLGGYAAALRRAKPASARVKVKSEVTSSITSNSEASKDGDFEPQKEVSVRGREPAMVQKTMPATAAPVVVKPPVWGGGRSFADVLAL